MKSNLRNFLLVLFTSGFFVACEPFVRKTPVVVADSAEEAFQQSDLIFSTVYHRVIGPRCVGCHGPGEQVNLETYENVKAHLAKVYQTAVLEKRMPKKPEPPLTDFQVKLLNAWISAGAPEGPR